MKWKKLGNVFCPEHIHPWMVSHAANPFAKQLDENLFRIYFTCRNIQNISHIGYVDVDMEQNCKIIAISESPVLAPGEAGLFDDSGTAVAYIIAINGKTHLYYLGWNLKVNVPWLNTIGLAIFDKELDIFVKYSRAPIMDRSDEDPFTISYPCILFDNGIYRMWYGSNLQWGKTQAEMMHVIKYAESTDGINWKRTGKIAVDLQHPNEYALSKPFVIKDNDDYKMWYSFRANADIDTYRIGLATSPDGNTWTRKDADAGISVSGDGWDSEMICYPFIFDWKGNRYMLYNGNGYGKTGFGIAVLEK